tara:strand:- start:848 stop:1147 length:300 start_codon:yes stop_codon:yes gene_type:complete
MPKVIPKKFLLPGGMRQLRVEHVTGKPSLAKINNPALGTYVKMVDAPSYWAIWLNANGDFTLGTYIKLLDNGCISRVTLHPDGTETVFKVIGDDDGTFD